MSSPLANENRTKLRQSTALVVPQPSVSPSPSLTPQSSEERVDPAALKAREAWRRVEARARRITPSGLAHFAILTVGFLLLGWLIWVCWSAFLPFQIGLVLAYITLPLVNRLSQAMSRPLAAFLVMLLEIGFVLGLISVLIPLLIQEVVRAVQGLPSQDELRAFIDNLRAQAQTFPEPIPTLLRDWGQQATQDFRSNIGDFVGRLLGLAATTVLGIFGTLSFVVSLLVLPTWILSVLRDQPRGARLLQSAIPQGVRTDIGAVGRIIDRTLRVYLRGLGLVGLIVGLATYAGFTILEVVGFEGIRYKILLSILAGLFTMIPTFGPIIGTILVSAISFTGSQDTGLAVLLMTIGIYILAGSLIAPQFQKKAITLHPAVLAMVLVAGSQFGPLGVLVAAPLAIIIRDLFRYVYWRTADPPRPAGVLPDEPQSRPVYRVHWNTLR